MEEELGVDGREYVIPPSSSATARSAPVPGVEITARGSRDSILTRLECAEQPTAQNTYSGNSTGKWCTPNTRTWSLVTGQGFARSNAAR